MLWWFVLAFLYAVMIWPCLLPFYAIAAIWFYPTAGILYVCNQIHVVTYFTSDRIFKFCLTKKIFMLVKKKKKKKCCFSIVRLLLLQLTAWFCFFVCLLIFFACPCSVNCWLHMIAIVPCFQQGIRVSRVSFLLCCLPNLNLPWT